DGDGNSDTATENETVTYTPVPSLKLEKIVVNQYGSDASESNWILYATGDEKGFNYTGDESKFIYVNPGVPYTLTESGPNGFSASAWSCTGGTLIENVITLTSEDDVTCTITNTAQPATVVVYKNVIDWNGSDAYSDQEFEVILEGELLVPSQNIRDSELEPMVATFGLLDEGIYTPTEINVPDGYIFNGCSVHTPILSDTEMSAMSVLPTNYVGNGETLTFVCENEAIQPELTITKDNDSPIDGLETGSTVFYTLRIEAPSDEIEGTYLVNNVKVTDILPEGFEYVLGSWTATSSIRGNIKDNPTIEPTYGGSPAIWILGDMKEGEIVTLTYIAKINLLNEPGIYKDLAFVQGDSILAEENTGDVLGLNTRDENSIGDNFVGTKVLVVEPIEEG
ncbi:MAG TPA: hypothetical protein PLD77_03140, partial [Candidatus Dojkabacteria bacterium]|nr:hypothetical protein [Candidatus Dojkabacteria bacterium]